MYVDGVGSSTFLKGGDGDLRGVYCYEMLLVGLSERIS
jgi:hypothetical protein